MIVNTKIIVRQRMLCILLWCCVFSTGSELFAQSNSKIKPKVGVLSFDENNNKSPTFKFIRKIENKKVYLPMLTMIFFEKNSAEIPVRYNTDYGIFNENSFLDPVYATKPPMYAYYQILNVIGTRLNLSKQKVRLLGCTDGKEDVSLAKSRAETIKSYWIKNYGVEASRIEIMAQAQKNGLPPDSTRSRPTNKPDETELIDQENRRVEIYGDWEIVKPIMVTKGDTTTSPPDLFFDYDFGIDTSNILKVELIVQQPHPDGKATDELLLKTYNFTDGFEPEFKWEVNKPENRDRQPKYETDMLITLVVTDKERRRYESEQVAIPVEQKDDTKTKVVGKSEKIVEFDLILFDYGKDNLTASHKKIIDIIKNENTNNELYDFGASVKITGYSDNTGNLVSNQTRSERRAISVSKYFKETLSYLRYFDASRVLELGSGATDLNRDQFGSPESRMYCRTVRIRIDNSN